MMKTNFIDIGEFKLHFCLKGKGYPLVIFESGYGGQLLEWKKVQQKIAKKK
ncbi:MAG: hypothetical protein GF308_06095 [Candidatus Heimdallarchaeota archaeon]|nr:hypothetical protein [Candidatus Heimdallarchaeota archaeon]